MLPVEISRTTHESQAELMLRADERLFWFRGHFPQQPLLPGIAQLDWAMRYGVEILAPQWRFCAVESLKFQRPVLPGNTLRLTLNWKEDKRQLAFCYHIVRARGDELPASNGKITLCQ
ncbi:MULTISPECIES: 3-hydroxyacyl-ACP dehydratase FabZ family protein [Lonsdalea]|uniref:Hydroxymyristoyl-ACP dehydratase n=2 Tax=Lonsdalea TaxID=1082702 RepID=A0ACD1JEN3_9GAMM|nr:MULTISPECIES: hydroxymyristoyl-ACP dehydratase [Lonsdalea]OSM94420.1 hydroxymyristoyl-ACP dehydratase [Lonsdalea populi]OSN00734.1 hydroxymyristoyl-ACP dehydratase [Lonsdalea populi]QPQ24206.1 hydroxymyristoyl-ACP dehydratase [Lonsdalea populi]RAT15041.1 hydroxymyristoyl-ACP dehydratase [Lonsdalea quercina]RAT21415.1 hydroxymyristoyl-ACP dehydratase [Lonsdalea populi]